MSAELERLRRTEIWIAWVRVFAVPVRRLRGGDRRRRAPARLRALGLGDGGRAHARRGRLLLARPPRPRPQGPRPDRLPGAGLRHRDRLRVRLRLHLRAEHAGVGDPLHPRDRGRAPLRDEGRRDRPGGRPAARLPRRVVARRGVRAAAVRLRPRHAPFRAPDPHRPGRRLARRPAAGGDGARRGARGRGRGPARPPRPSRRRARGRQPRGARARLLARPGQAFAAFRSELRAWSPFDRLQIELAGEADTVFATCGRLPRRRGRGGDRGAARARRPCARDAHGRPRRRAGLHLRGGRDGDAAREPGRGGRREHPGLRGRAQRRSRSCAGSRPSAPTSSPWSRTSCARPWPP